MTAPVLQVRGLTVEFTTRRGVARVLDDVGLEIHRGQTLGVVGESGCGKSVTALAVMRLIASPPGRIVGGEVLFDGRDLLALPESEMRRVRGNRVSMIFQEPMTSLNPAYTVGDQIGETLRLHEGLSRRAALERTVAMLDAVGIPAPAQRVHEYPHQFSGGMRQRVMIAMALACRPKVLLADEPTTALDVTIQAQILELLRELQSTRDMGIMLITHNLGVVAENADVVCVMYAGRVVEYANVFELFDEPLHPYTRGLFRSIPMLRDVKHRLVTVRDVTNDPAEFRRIPGAVPWWPDMPAGTRPDVVAGRDEHVLVEVRPNRWVGCWRTPELEGRTHRRPSLEYRRDDR